MFTITVLLILVLAETFVVALFEQKSYERLGTTNEHLSKISDSLAIMAEHMEQLNKVVETNGTVHGKIER